ncbi:hypothetical protein CTI12_AA581560 [Artemisia annua]|uniref:DUF674 domain-containing protein n=1 Tax=Artemisia annua TaxID=35608 RepID=A0A2U1KNU4_ARTAN|nr:hypothetical protein CTI12_AA581560 [Artemisia annua]
MATPKMSLKLLVDKKGQRVLFAEAPKEFVDFIFHIFSLPLGTLIEFIGSKEMVGSLGKLKDSIESFHGTYLQPGVKKDNIFNPKTPFNGSTFLLSYNASSTDQASSSKAIYRCSNASTNCGYCSNRSSCRSNVTLDPKSICPNCGGSMNVAMTRIQPKDAEVEVAAMEKINKGGGYVKEVVTYMVMDDLVVKPMSTISSITLINKFGVKDLSQLEEKMVTFGKDEGLKLLKASLMTDKVLTTIFMH